MTAVMLPIPLQAGLLRITIKSCMAILFLLPSQDLSTKVYVCQLLSSNEEWIERAIFLIGVLVLDQFTDVVSRSTDLEPHLYRRCHPIYLGK